MIAADAKTVAKSRVVPCRDQLIFRDGTGVQDGAMSQITIVSGVERRRRWTDQRKRDLVAVVLAPRHPDLPLAVKPGL